MLKMLSVIVKKSYGSVKVFWLNKELLKKELVKIAKKIKSCNDNVKDIILFGSVKEDKATPFSDIDISIIVKKSSKRFIERPLEFIDYFKEIPLGVDLFVYTEEEVERKNNPFLSYILSSGKSLLGE
ncbi:MAG: hypothetical protein B6D56_02320 [Candidatus Omnitrophica bacterium 4484_70.1]|nr:MAG: hypothetical protein B6D56_02320 [Candidatus Omnitrophica bacterium 4484_70.1]